MLNEDKVKLMTRAAIYEKHAGKKNMKMTKYFRGDYVSWNMIKTAVAVTLAYMLLAGCWVLYHLEYLMENLYTMDLAELIRRIVMYYAAVLAAYMIVAYIVYTLKYSRAMKSLKRFRGSLKKIRQISHEETKGGEE